MKGYYYSAQYNACFSNCPYPTTLNGYACVWNGW
jgi:hypothetical protein